MTIIPHVYYFFYVKMHLHDLFHKQLSYNHFVELEMMLFLQLFALVDARA